MTIKCEQTTVTINLENYEFREFDEQVVEIDAWYDRHTRLWCIQKLNKTKDQIGDAIWVYGKVDAMNTKKELEEEYGI